MMKKFPSDDALTGMPGDTLEYCSHSDGDSQTLKTGIVELALWMPAPKGGKVWSYRLRDGTTVPNDRVTKVGKIN